MIDLALTLYHKEYNISRVWAIFGSQPFRKQCPSPIRKHLESLKIEHKKSDTSFGAFAPVMCPFFIIRRASSKNLTNLLRYAIIKSVQDRRRECDANEAIAGAFPDDPAIVGWLHRQ